MDVYLCVCIIHILFNLYDNIYIYDLLLNWIHANTVVLFIDIFIGSRWCVFLVYISYKSEKMQRNEQV